MWAKTSAGAIGALCFGMVTRHSLDHDLSGDDTTRSGIGWMRENGVLPQQIRVHCASPVGVEWLPGMIDRYRTCLCIFVVLFVTCTLLAEVLRLDAPIRKPLIDRIWAFPRTARSRSRWND